MAKPDDLDPFDVFAALETLERMRDIATPANRAVLRELDGTFLRLLVTFMEARVEFQVAELLEAPLIVVKLPKPRDPIPPRGSDGRPN